MPYLGLVKSPEARETMVPALAGVTDVTTQRTMTVFPAGPLSGRIDWDKLLNH